MIKNYLVTALRIIKRQRFYAIINVMGLAIGMACFILIILWVKDELSYDRFHKDHHNLYRVLSVFEYPNGNWYSVNNPLPLAKELKEKYPEIKNYVRIDQYNTTTVGYKDKLFHENRFTYADPGLFTMFSFPFIDGDTSGWYNDPFSVVLSETMARKYFGDDNPGGKVLRIDGEDDFIVRGVFRDFPPNSSIQCDFVVPIEVLGEFGIDMESWNSFAYRNFVELHTNTDVSALEEKIKDVINEHEDRERSHIRLQPIEKIHLYKRNGEKEGMRYVIIFTVIAFAILIIACINYTNLSTARAIKRTREIALRKVVGATRSQICLQTFMESVLVAFIGVIIAMMLVELVRPAFNVLTGKNITISYLSLQFILVLVGIAFVTGILSGSYPALVVSSFNPVKAYTAGRLGTSGKSYFRIILVVFQFFVTILLIVSTMVIVRQLDYMMNKELGINTENMIYIPCDDLASPGFDGFKTELLQNPDIKRVTRTFQIPSYNRLSVPWQWEGMDPGENHSINISIVDEDYIDAFGINISEGRGFSHDFSTDSSKIIVNKTAVKLMQMDNPVGKKIRAWDDNEILGVMEDYHFMPLSTEIQPLGLIFDPRYFSYMIVRLSGNDIAETLDYVEEAYRKFHPEDPYTFTFIDADFELLYRSERRISRLTRYFSILSIFVACLGLIGLASYMANNRTKEIGIRKVVGATVPGIIYRLTYTFLRWVFIALILAVPVSWYVMYRWLNEYVYKIQLAWWIFALAGAVVLVIAFLTVALQAYMAARKNPVDSLRYE